MLRHLAQLHDRTVVQEGNIFEPLDRRRRGAGAGVDEDLVGAHAKVPATVQVDFQLPRACEAGLAPEEVQVLRALKLLLAAAPEGLDYVALALPDLLHVHAHRAGPDAVVGGAASEVGRPSTGDHRLGGGAAFVHAAPADVAALDDHRVVSGAGERGCERFTSLSGPYDGSVVVASLGH